MKKEINPATAVIVVLVVIAVVAGIVWAALNKQAGTSGEQAPPPGTFPAKPGATTTAPAPSAPAPVAPAGQ